jgi:hypothetical protein
VRDDRQEEIGLTVDLEIESISVIHTRLPDVVRFVVFLGTKRWVSKVRKEERQLLLELDLTLSG